ncbi:TonB-dependent siderophore receptor [Bowmanella yangjiangensis]|uniref:TonB-dependent siderophore receptor n=1 Tax=Bowmanella yangjiangensis TaxID=2811230 RepID=A0ABS3CSJ4_9ALTE|nr:TonB-dependent siderophore receptor [Bowmanella yangjiangensis]MBN7819265.1 TonB-dependent siderophore receptor [Bowmanella yangjiangensis]
MKLNRLSTALVMAALPSFLYAAEEPQSSREKEVETITVKSKRGLISYVSATGAKSDTPIIETPLSVSVLTPERLDDLGAYTIQDAMGYVAGLYNGPYGVDTRGDWAQIRATAPVQYIDGLRAIFGYYNNVRLNPFSLSQIEILKGPSSVLYGQGSTGGIVNLVSKRPQPETQGEFWAQMGNHNRKQAALDFTGSLTDDEALLGRVIGVWRDSDTQTDYVDDNSLIFAPSVSWQATDQTKLTLLGNWQKNESGSSTQFFPHQGTLLDNEFGQIPSHRFVSEPGFDRYDTEQQSVTAIIEHDLNQDWRLRLASRYSDSHADYRTMYAWPPVFQDDNRTVIRSISMSDNSAISVTSDMQLHGWFYTGNIEHQVVLGLNYQHAKTDADQLYIAGGGGPLDLYAPEYGNVTNLPDTDQLNDGPFSKNYQLGLYVQDNMKIADKWLVSAALRRDKAITSPQSGNSDYQYATTGRLGLMYLFDNGISPYISYSESFSPLLGNDAYGHAFVPLQGRQWETGLKYQPAGTEHLLTASLYQIKEQNRTTSLTAEQRNEANIIDPNGQVQQGEVEVKGVELEAQLAWDELDIYASYAYTDAEVSKSHKLGELGATISATPDHQASLWATWRPEQWQGFKLGAGIRFVGNTSDGSAYVEQNGLVLNEPLLTPSYTLFDAMIGYDFEKYSLSLHANNLTDKTVLTSCLARGDCFYGAQRSITANLKYRF